MPVHSLSVLDGHRVDDVALHYIMEDISTRNRMRRIRCLKELLYAKKTTLTIGPSCEAYPYFLEEFRNKLTFDHENIIVPTSEKNSTRKLK